MLIPYYNEFRNFFDLNDIWRCCAMDKKLSINNMNGVAEDEDTTCGITNLNCIGDDEDTTCDITDLNCIGDDDTTCGIVDMNCIESKTEKDNK